jgi:uncharacterized protein YicC (UPF0701 family)
VPESLETTLTARLREVLASGNPTEATLRELTAEGRNRARSLATRIRASEKRLRALNADPASPISAIAEELRRVETLRPHLQEVRKLLADLDERGRTLRTAWLLGQVEATRARGAGPTS